MFGLIKTILEYLECDIDYLLHQLNEYHEICIKNGNYIEAEYIAKRAIPNVEKMKANKLYHIYMIAKREPSRFIIASSCMLMFFFTWYYVMVLYSP